MGAFEERAGRAGYDETGRAISGMAGSQARDEDRRRIQGQKNVIRQAQKNARDALRNGDMKSWTEWTAAAGGTTSAIPNADQVNKNAAGMVYRNTNDAANMRPVGAPPDPNQPVSQQPPANSATAPAGAPANPDAPNAPPQAPVDGGMPNVGLPAPTGTTEQSTRDALSGASSTNPYGLPSVDQENARRAELEKQGAFGTKSKAFEAFEQAKEKRRAVNNLIERGLNSKEGLTDELYAEAEKLGNVTSSDKLSNSYQNAVNKEWDRRNPEGFDRREAADNLKQQYISGAMGKEEFLEKGKAIGGTDKSLSEITTGVDKTNNVASANRDKQNKISDNNERILSQYRNTGGLETRDPDYNPKDPKYVEATLERDARDSLAKSSFAESQKKFNNEMGASSNRQSNIESAKQLFETANTREDKAIAKATLKQVNDQIAAKGRESEADVAQRDLNRNTYQEDARKFAEFEGRVEQNNAKERTQANIGVSKYLADTETNYLARTASAKAKKERDRIREQYGQMQTSLFAP
jgi:hypothetical protein